MKKDGWTTLEIVILPTESATRRVVQLKYRILTGAHQERAERLQEASYVWTNDCTNRGLPIVGVIVMIEMNPYYAHESSIGPVFDVATWSPRKAVTSSIIAVVLGGLICVAIAYLWDPSLFLDDPPELIASLNDEIAELHKQYAHGLMIGMACTGLVGIVFLVGGVFSLIGACEENYYFRVGTGGLSVRLLDGLDWSKLGFGVSVLEIELAWDEIKKWKVIQTKQFGALSRNAGNIGADFSIKARDGKSYSFSLDLFREPGHIIYDRIKEMQEAVPADLGNGSHAQSDDEQLELAV